MMIVFYILATVCFLIFVKYKIKRSKCNAGNHDWYHYRRTIDRRPDYGGGMEGVTQKYVACDFCGMEKEGTLEDERTRFYSSYSAPSSYFDEIADKGFRIDSGPRRCGKYSEDDEVVT